ncbi:MAG: hypothetical protein US70_C0003G0007 [Parcubacteria group bacterium GW2011_GWD2_38_11]|nr:MAG: hypothetical protein US70_C0003G0007 [Parcubacteria group bacterium GW2011_GWD2_38_11]
MRNVLPEETRKKIVLIIGNTFSKEQENIMQQRIIALFFQLLASVSKKANHEIKESVQHFICFFMAHFSAVKSAGAVKADFLFQTFMESKDKTILNFLDSICPPQCRKEDSVHVDIIFKIGAILDDREINDKVDLLLIKLAKKKVYTEFILDAIEKHLSLRSSLLQTCAQIDHDRAYELCVRTLTNKNALTYKKTALEILSSLSLGIGQLKLIIKNTVNLLGNTEFASDYEARQLLYALVAKATKAKALEKSELSQILQTAFRYESSSQGLEKLIKLVCNLDKKISEDIIFQGLLSVETRKNSDRFTFTFRDKIIKDFLQKLSFERRSFFLQTAIMKSKDDDFLWYGCKELLLCDTISVATKTLEKAIRNGSQEKIGVITRFVLAIREKTHGYGKDLEKIPRAELEQLVQKVLACTQTKKNGTGFEIAKNTIMSDGKPDDIKKVLPVLHSIALQCDRNFTETVHLLLVCNSDERKMAKKEARTILDDLYAKKRPELLAVLVGLVKNPLSWDCTCLCSSALDFLARHKITEVIPEVATTLMKGWRNNDINYACIRFFSEVSIAGSTEAVKILTAYVSSNVISDTIPKALVEIYKKTSIGEIKQLILLGLRERFTTSIKENCIHRMFYLSELEALEKLRVEDGIFDIYLAGIETIGKSEQHSPGMDNIIKKAAVFTGKKKMSAVKALLGPMITILERKKGTLSEHFEYEREHRRAITHIVHAATTLLIA